MQPPGEPTPLRSALYPNLTLQYHQGDHGEFATVTAGERMLTFTPQYAGVTGQPISFSVVNEMLPTTSPGPYTLRLYTDNPTITLKATQTGSPSEASFAYNWLAVCGEGPPPPPPPTGTFSITGVTTVSLLLLLPVNATNVYPSVHESNRPTRDSSVVNEMLPTTSPGPTPCDSILTTPPLH